MNGTDDILWETDAEAEASPSDTDWDPNDNSVNNETLDMLGN